MSTGRIPEEIIEAVLKQNDIVDVVGRYVQLSKQGHYMKGLCPFHSEKTPSFTVTPEKQIYHCYGCHAGGNAIHFLKEIEGYSFAEAVRQLAEDAQIAVEWEQEDSAKTEKQLETDQLFKAYDLSAQYYHYLLLNTEQGKRALDYLLARGMTMKWIEFFRLGYAPSMWDKLVQFLKARHMPLPLMEQGGLISSRTEGEGYFDKFRDRAIFPIADAKGRVIAFAGRSMGDAQPKYLNSPESVLFNKSRTLYQFHHARPAIRSMNQVVIFEGYMDIIRTWASGVENGVATMGTALTEHHAQNLKRNTDHALICFDGDQAGQAAAFKSIPTLEKVGLHVKVCMLPKGMDPDEYLSSHSPDDFRQEIIDAAVPAIKYKMLHIRKNFNMQDVDARLRYIESAVAMIAELASPVERQHYVKELIGEYPHLEESIKQTMNESRQKIIIKEPQGDNNQNSWNNGRNNRQQPVIPPLLPAYHMAERMLLSLMMHDSETALYVQEQLGDGFHIEVHAALAAYLYAYYALGYEPDVSRYLATLQDDKLERAASSILMMETDPTAHLDVVNAYIREIRKVPQQMLIARKREEQLRANRAKEYGLAAQIGIEIIALEKQLKAL